MPLLDHINQISKYTMCTCCGQPAGLFSHMLVDIERELFPLQLWGENSVLASFSRRPGYHQITEIPLFDLLEADTRVADVPRSLDVMNDQLIVCKHAFDSLAVKMTSIRQGDHG